MAKKQTCKKKNGIDQRIYLRKDVRIFGVFRKDIELNETEIMMTNLSQGGAFIIVDDPPLPGHPVMLQFMLPGDESPVSAIGTVMWVRKSVKEGQRKGMGVRFDNINRFDLERLKKYIQKLMEEELFGNNP